MKVKVTMLSILLVLSFSTSSLAAVVDGEDYVLVPSVLELSETTESYTVIEGDNLYRIALAHDIPLELLMDWNNLTGELIHPGDVLRVSEADNETNDVASVNEPDVFTVASVIEQPPIQKPEIPKPKTNTKSFKSTAKAQSPPAIAAATTTAEPADGVEMTVTATAYTAYCDGCSGTTAYGIDLRANPNQKVIAVDPRVIPLGTKVWIEGYGTAIAGDTGGAIKGNKIDVFIPSYESAMAWGVKKVKIKVFN